MATFERIPTVMPADHVPGPKQGHWTYNHYAALSDDGQRYEIIDGVLYMAPSPSDFHQSTVSLLVTYLTIHVQFKGLGRVYPAPFDVQLAPNVVVQPDVLVVLNENSEKITHSRIIGPPDLVVEIVSPSTAAYDRMKKRNTYARASVREYWIVDPLVQNIEVLVLEDSIYRSVGIFTGNHTLPSQVVPEFPVQVMQFFS